MKLCTCRTKTPELRYHSADCEYRVEQEERLRSGGPLTLSLRIPLKATTTLEAAQELAELIVQNLSIEPSTTPAIDLRHVIDAVYYSIDNYDGHNLGL